MDILSDVFFSLCNQLLCRFGIWRSLLFFSLDFPVKFIQYLKRRFVSGIPELLQTIIHQSTGFIHCRIVNTQKLDRFAQIICEILLYDAILWPFHSTCGGGRFAGGFSG